MKSDKMMTLIVGAQTGTTVKSRLKIISKFYYQAPTVSKV